MKSVGMRYRLSVCVRCLCAGPLGYLITARCTARLSLALPRHLSFNPSEAVLAATMWSFALWALVVIWVFGVRRLGLAVGLPCAVYGLAWHFARTVQPTVG